MAFTWLASYPKSGNTWMRAFLTAYQAGSADINALRGAGLITSRQLFDDYMSVTSSEMRFDEILRLRSDFHSLLATSMHGHSVVRSFAKTHDAFRQSPDGWALFPAEASAGCIYIVRNPLDVAVSYAHHEARSIDWAIDRMADPDARLAWWSNAASTNLPEALSTWSDHVASWLDQTLIPVHLVAYELMIRDPHTAFAGVLRFADVEVDDGLLDMAIAATQFDVLRDQEAAVGFNEKTQASASFFRKGQSGGWREALTDRQIARLVSSHGPVMERLGYLQENAVFPILDR